MDGDAFNLVLWLIALALLSYLSQEMQILRAIGEIETYIAFLRTVRDKAIGVLASQFRRYDGGSGGVGDQLERRLSSLVETYFIFPVDLDPFGVVRKIKHVLRTGEERIRREVSLLARDASPAEVQNLASLVEVARELNMIYKVVNHYYLIARKFRSLWLILQLSAQMPFVLEEVRAVEGALESFSRGLPIGDSAGPLVASLLVRRYGGTYSEPVKDTLVARLNVENRSVYVVRAKGPGGTTGRLEEAVAWVLSRERASLLISVDAALKYEGEESGLVAHGFGIAMGGVGAERFEIEEMATRYGMPAYAVLIKMSEAEALSTMTEKVYRGALQSADIITDIIRQQPEKSTIIVLGVGNTLGVPP